jgi:hypothetical protein
VRVTPSIEQLQRVNINLARELVERARAEERLQLANTTLEKRAAERLAELRTLNET